MCTTTLWYMLIQQIAGASKAKVMSPSMNLAASVPHLSILQHPATPQLVNPVSWPHYRWGMPPGRGGCFARAIGWCGGHGIFQPFSWNCLQPLTKNIEKVWGAWKVPDLGVIRKSDSKKVLPREFNQWIGLPTELDIRVPLQWDEGPSRSGSQYVPVSLKSHEADPSAFKPNQKNQLFPIFKVEHWSSDPCGVTLSLVLDDFRMVLMWLECYLDIGSLLNFCSMQDDTNFAGPSSPTKNWGSQLFDFRRGMRPETLSKGWNFQRSNFPPASWNVQVESLRSLLDPKIHGANPDFEGATVVTSRHRSTKIRNVWTWKPRHRLRPSWSFFPLKTLQSKLLRHRPVKVYEKVLFIHNTLSSKPLPPQKTESVLSLL